MEWLSRVLRIILANPEVQPASSRQGEAPASDHSSDRTEFLLHMYDTAWSNISRTDELVWKLYTSYTALVVGAVVLTDKFLHSPFYGILAVLLITGVAISHSFNVNGWFLRNLLIITNIEAEFLQSSDYGKIIPQRWHPPYRGRFFYWEELPAILGFVYPGVAALLVIAYWKRMSPGEQNISAIVSAGLSVLICWYVCSLKNRFERLKTDAPGKVGPTRG